MKKIGIDARLLFQTGVGTYVQNLLHYLGEVKNDSLSYKVFILPGDRVKAQSWFPTFQFISSPFKWHTLDEQLGFGMQLEREKLDLMHFTYFGHPVWYKRPFISTIHDLTPLYHATGIASRKNRTVYMAKKCAYSFVLSNQIKRSLHVITPSHTVKEQIISYVANQSYASRISSIHEGVNFRLMELKDKNNNRKYTDPYYLYVGNYYPHKNIYMLLRTYKKINTRKMLVLAGPDDYFRKKILDDIPTLREDDRIKFYPSPSTQDIASLYAYCDAVINPSFSEGFGLPLVEAAFFQKPIIASEIPVFREILGESFYAFDPYSQESMHRTISAFELENQPKIAATRYPMSFKSMTKKIHTLYQSYA